MPNNEARPPSHSLDPADWAAFRAQGHRMLDDILDYLEHIRERPVWQPIPDAARAKFREASPAAPSDLAELHARFLDDILPYTVGNAHPGFMGWVHGGGTPVGLLAEMLAAGLNANLGGRDHLPIEVERQVAVWAAEWFGFPGTAQGLFVTGASLANFVAVLTARAAALGEDVRRQGVAASGQRLVAYASSAAHGCLPKAMDMAGLGSAALRRIPVNARDEISVDALAAAVAADRAAGLVPFLVVGTAGTVETGAIDDLAGLAAFSAREQLWFHVDGAYGALAILSPELAPRLAGIEQADSVAFDFHKWGQVPYDAGFVLCRDGARQLAAFASTAAYLRRDARGLAAGSPWPCDFGPDLSRGFRALKVWFTLKAYGTERLGQMIAGTCALARYLGAQVEARPELELLAPVSLNIVCFRYRAADSDAVNAAIVADLHESGIAVPSAATVAGHIAIRAAIVNHRTTAADLDALLRAVLAFGAARAPSAPA